MSEENKIIEKETYPAIKPEKKKGKSFRDYENKMITDECDK